MHIATNRPLLLLSEDTLRAFRNSKYTCFSKNVVYAINCRTCNKMYIGETGRRLGDRFREHLRSTDLPVGCHFTVPDHSVGDMLVSFLPRRERPLLAGKRAFFSWFKINHRGRGSTLETSGFSCPFNAHFDKLCKSHFQRGPLCLYICLLTKALANFSHFRPICHFCQNGNCVHLSPFSSKSPL